MISMRFLICLAVMASVTYLLRMLPIVVLRQKIKNRFLLSFLHYIPVAVLSVMVVPAVFYASDSIVSAAAGFAVALVLSFFEKSLIQVACAACAAVFVLEIIMKYL